MAMEAACARWWREKAFARGRRATVEQELMFASGRKWLCAAPTAGSLRGRRKGAATRW